MATAAAAAATTGTVAGDSRTFSDTVAAESRTFPATVDADDTAGGLLSFFAFFFFLSMASDFCQHTVFEAFE